MGKTLLTAGRCYDDQCIQRATIDSIWFQPGCAIKLILPGRENHREVKLAWVEANYPNFILVRIDTSKGSYRMSLNKVDIAQKEIIVKEVV